MTVDTIVTLATALVPLALAAYIIVATKLGLPVPSTANQKLVEAATRFASGALVTAHAKGLDITSPEVIADSISNASALLTANYAETLVQAGATAPDLIEHFAASATAAAISSLLPSLGKSPTA